MPQEDDCLPARETSPLSVTGVSHRFNTCNFCRCSEMSCNPTSPNWNDTKCTPSAFKLSGELQNVWANEVICVCVCVCVYMHVCVCVHTCPCECICGWVYTYVCLLCTFQFLHQSSFKTGACKNRVKWQRQDVCKSAKQQGELVS